MDTGYGKLLADMFFGMLVAAFIGGCVVVGIVASILYYFLG